MKTTVLLSHIHQQKQCILEAGILVFREVFWETVRFIVLAWNKENFVIWSSSWICKVLWGNRGIFFSSVHVFILHLRKFSTLVDTFLLTPRNKWPVVKIWLCPGGHEVNLLNLDHPKSSVPLGWKRNWVVRLL